MTTGYTEADLAKLRANMLEGVKETSMGGRRMVFHSLAEMRAFYDAVAAEIAAASAPVRRRQAYQVVVDC